MEKQPYAFHNRAPANSTGGLLPAFGGYFTRPNTCPNEFILAGIHRGVLHYEGKATLTRPAMYRFEWPVWGKTGVMAR